MLSCMPLLLVGDAICFDVHTLLHFGSFQTIGLLSHYMAVSGVYIVIFIKLDAV
jgi:hypothetical protein